MLMFALSVLVLASILALFYVEGCFDLLMEKIKPKKPVINNWSVLRHKLYKLFLDDKREFLEYEDSHQIVKMFKSPPALNCYIRKELFNNLKDAPFKNSQNGSIVLKDKIKEKINEDPEGVEFKDASNFVQLTAEYDALYTVLTADDNFYQNRYVDEEFQKIYNTSFMKTIDRDMKVAAIRDVSANVMDKKYLSSALMQKSYQENYVMERASIQKAQDNLKDNYKALTALHKTHSISTQDFVKAFGDETIEFVERNGMSQAERKA